MLLNCQNERACIAPGTQKSTRTSTETSPRAVVLLCRTRRRIPHNSPTIFVLLRTCSCPIPHKHALPPTFCAPHPLMCAHEKGCSHYRSTLRFSSRLACLVSTKQHAQHHVQRQRFAKRLRAHFVRMMWHRLRNVIPREPRNISLRMIIAGSILVQKVRNIRGGQPACAAV